MSDTRTNIDRIADKARQGQRLDADDGLALLVDADLHTLGALADEAKRRLHGDAVFYNVNRHINYTNLCVLRCRFCSFCRGPDDADAYELSNAAIAEIASRASERGATEIHLTGGLHPGWMIEHYEQMIEAIRSSAPRLHIKAFTAVEVAHIARLSRISVSRALHRLVASGLCSLPGGGAEIFDPRVHDEAFVGKMSEDQWFDVHRTAHAMGLPTNATMLYGHLETPAERIRHLVKLRDFQDETGGLQCFVPLSFAPAGSQLAELPGPSGQDDLRTMAVARLMLDNVPHIKTFWVMHGLKLSQVALDFGADDIDGTVGWYDIVKDAGRGRDQRADVNDLRRLIREAGRTPVERGSLYRRVIRAEDRSWRVESPSPGA